MPVTVNINGISLSHKGSTGVVTATIPDVCKTPSPGGPVPIPYPNIAFSKDLAKGTTTVTADGSNSCAVKGSEFFMSIGDEPGTAGGVKSGTFKGKATWLTYSMDVKLDGKNACRLTDKMLMNKGNTVSMGGELQAPVTPSAIKAMRDHLCELACECYEEGKGQACLNKKIEKQHYKGKYPKKDSYLWREVSMEKKGGKWGIVKQNKGKGPMPSSNPFTRGGGIRPDAVAVDGSGKPQCIFEMKFPGDTLRDSQKRHPNSKYSKAAKQFGVNYDVIDDCPCFPKPKKRKSAAGKTSKSKRKKTVAAGAAGPASVGGIAGK
ncbi:PAAR-like domain-containing protein [Yoonia sp. SS1-5]|uniref:PAAR-like domain-containing protein n=1 Tax=Yoonia rhodophyticola TaxID=3137370 RepID=A0AAN0MCE2_9RHOB